MPVYSVIPSSLRPQGLARWCLCLWDFPGKNTGVGCHSLLQGIFPTQGLETEAGGFFTTEPRGKTSCYVTFTLN